MCVRSPLHFTFYKEKFSLRLKFSEESIDKTSGSEGYVINLDDMNQLLRTNMFTEGDIITKNDFIINKIKNECKEKDLDKYTET